MAATGATGPGPSHGTGAELVLRYGLNPHQERAALTQRPAAFTVLNGSPGYLNVLDALTGWELVRDGRAALGRPVAASIKHAAPNGIGTDTPLSPEEAAACQAPAELSAIALAYVRARGTDRVAAYGDLIALSEEADESFARAVSPEASTGVIAPGYQPAALDLLRRKRKGAFLVLRADPGYEPGPEEHRDVFGVRLRQDRNQVVVDAAALSAPVTRRRELPADAVRDLLIATLAARWAQSNAVCVAARGQTIGIGAGQPSRVRATRLACRHARQWLLRGHPALAHLRPAPGMSRHDLDTAVSEFLDWPELHPAARRRLRDLAVPWPAPLTAGTAREWTAAAGPLALSTDGPFPFADSLHTAALLPVRFVAQPGGARRDADVVAAADDHDMTMVTFGSRLFHH
jgi:phosphoribosylaminoimidazolecarboxamide formyltransferase/IMP cyclohydrolase